MQNMFQSLKITCNNFKSSENVLIIPPIVKVYLLNPSHYHFATLCKKNQICEAGSTSMTLWLTIHVCACLQIFSSIALVQLLSCLDSGSSASLLVLVYFFPFTIFTVIFTSMLTYLCLHSCLHVYRHLCIHIQSILLCMVPTS